MTEIQSGDVFTSHAHRVSVTRISERDGRQWVHCLLEGLHEDLEMRMAIVPLEHVQGHLESGFWRRECTTT